MSYGQRCHPLLEGCPGSVAAAGAGLAGTSQSADKGHAGIEPACVDLFTCALVVQRDGMRCDDIQIADGARVEAVCRQL